MEKLNIKTTNISIPSEKQKVWFQNKEGRTCTQRIMEIMNEQTLKTSVIEKLEKIIPNRKDIEEINWNAISQAYRKNKKHKTLK